MVPENRRGIPKRARKRLLLVVIAFFFICLVFSLQSFRVSIYVYDDNEGLMQEVPSERTTQKRPSGTAMLKTVWASVPHTQQHNNPPPSRPRFAYAFVIAGCDPDKPVYRYYIYNIFIVADVLRELGSKADIMAFFQLSYNSSGVILPAQDQKMLDAMNIRVKYIPKHPSESFYRVQFEKFRIINMTEYERVLYMDTDVVPIANLDYLFELSVEGVLKENIIVPGTNSPANGGFFMMKPNITAMKHLNNIVMHRHEEAKHMPFPHFDPIRGWGHVVRPPDKWKTLRLKTDRRFNSSGILWNFNAAYADQGLLYHWVKYVQMSVSILRWDGIVENWSANATTRQVELQEQLHEVFHERNYTDLIQVKNNRWQNGPPPFSHYIHMAGGSSKPWKNVPKEDFFKKPNKNLTVFEDPIQFWFYRLNRLNERLALGIDFGKWAPKKEARSPLGIKPTRNSTLTADINLMASLYTTEAEGKLLMLKQQKFYP